MGLWVPEGEEFGSAASDLLGRKVRSGLPSPEDLAERRLVAALRQDDAQSDRQRSQLEGALSWLAPLEYQDTPLRMLAEQTIVGDIAGPTARDFVHTEFRLDLIAFWTWKGFATEQAGEVAQESILWLYTGRLTSLETASLDEWSVAADIAGLGSLDTPMARKALAVGLERYGDRRAIDELVAEPEFKDGCRILADRLMPESPGTGDGARRTESAVVAATKVANHLHVALRPRIEESVRGRGVSSAMARRVAQETILHLLADVETVGFV